MKKGVINERPTTVEEAFQQTGRPQVDFTNVPEDLREYFEGIYSAVVVTEAINKGQKPDWDNSNERKWRPWFVMSPARFRWDGTAYGHSISFAGSGSRLCNFSDEDATYSATQFADVWRKVQLG